MQSSASSRTGIVYCGVPRTDPVALVSRCRPAVNPEEFQLVSKNLPRSIGILGGSYSSLLPYTPTLSPWWACRYCHRLPPGPIPPTAFLRGAWSQQERTLTLGNLKPSPQTVPGQVKHHVASPARGAHGPHPAAAGPPVYGQHCTDASRGATQHRMGVKEAGYAPDGLGGADARRARGGCK